MSDIILAHLSQSAASTGCYSAAQGQSGQEYEDEGDALRVVHGTLQPPRRSTGLSMRQSLGAKIPTNNNAMPAQLKPIAFHGNGGGGGVSASQ
jgi:hypothetical protein